VFVCDKCSARDETTEVTSVPILSRASAATTRYDCENSILLLVSLFCSLRGSRVVAVRVSF
jgi:hypothetical protein